MFTLWSFIGPISVLFPHLKSYFYLFSEILSVVFACYLGRIAFWDYRYFSLSWIICSLLRAPTSVLSGGLHYFKLLTASSHPGFTTLPRGIFCFLYLRWGNPDLRIIVLEICIMSTELHDIFLFFSRALLYTILYLICCIIFKVFLKCHPFQASLCSLWTADSEMDCFFVVSWVKEGTLIENLTVLSSAK